MTETLSNEISDTTEKEIEIKINDNIQESAEPKNEINEPPPKRVGALTDAERELIVNNAKNNIDMKNYRVTFYKNGEHRIVLKKSHNNVASKVINSNTTVPTPKQATYTDNQLLMEHIIELNSKYDRLHLKQKKLKKKYKSIRDDVYTYDNEQENIVPMEQAQPNQNIITQQMDPPMIQQRQQTNQVITRMDDIPPAQAYRPQYNMRTNWRSRLTVL